MPSWAVYILCVPMILLWIAPGLVLGPLLRLVHRYVGAGVVGLASLGIGSYTLGVAATEQAHWIGVGELGVGALCAAWSLYRLVVPAYRDQAPDSAVVDDR